MGLVPKWVRRGLVLAPAVATVGVLAGGRGPSSPATSSTFRTAAIGAGLVCVPSGVDFAGRSSRDLSTLQCHSISSTTSTGTALGEVQVLLFPDAGTEQQYLAGVARLAHLISTPLPEVQLLKGPRFVVSGETRVLRALQGRVGGVITYAPFVALP